MHRGPSHTPKNCTSVTNGFIVVRAVREIVGHDGDHATQGQERRPVAGDDAQTRPRPAPWNLTPPRWPPWARFAGCLALLTILALPSTVYGQESRKVALDFLLTLGQNQQALQSTTVLNPRFALGIPTSRNLRVNMEWGLVTASVGATSEDGERRVSTQETRFLNPTVEVAYSDTLRKSSFDLNFRVGLGLSFPVADADDPLQSGTYQVALSSSGLWEPWLYLPETLGFIIPISVTLNFRNFVMLADTAVFLLVPTDDTSSRSTQLGPQVGF